MDPLVPDAFALQGTSELAAGFLHVIRCEGTTDNESLLGPVTLIQVFANVEPVNASWTDEDHTDFYLLDSASDNVGVSAAIEGVGLPTLNASASMTTQTLPDGSQAWAWDFDASAWRIAIDVSIPHTPGYSPINRTLESYYWSGDGPFLRVAFVRTGTSFEFVGVGESVSTGGNHASATGGSSPFPVNMWEQGAFVYQSSGEWK